MSVIIKCPTKDKQKLHTDQSERGFGRGRSPSRWWKAQLETMSYLKLEIKNSFIFVLTHRGVG